MKEILNQANVKILHDEKEASLVLQYNTIETIQLSSQDMFNNVKLFKAVEDIKHFENNGLSCVSFFANAKTEQGNCSAQYTICLKDNTVLIITKLFQDNNAKPELPFEWLRLNTNGVNTVHCIEPQWKSKVELLKIPTSFKKNMVLEYAGGFAGFFCSGEPAYDPKKNRACPDMWVETAGITGFNPLHTAVIAFSNTDDFNQMQLQAQNIYQKAKNLINNKTDLFAGKEYSFSSGDLKFVLMQGTDGAALSSVTSMGNTTRACMPLVELRLQNLKNNKEITVNSLSGWADVQIVSENGGGKVVLCGREEWQELSVELRFDILSEQHRVEWSTHILNDEQELSVISASYPPSPWSANKASCFVPEHCGWVAENVTDIHFYRDGIYPRGWRFTMSYFAAYTDSKNENNGFYCAVHDADGAFRTMNVQTNPIDKTGLFFARAHAIGMGKGANAFTLPGKLVWQAFKGDWYDATLIYKQFVHTQAKWLPEVGEQGREDTPLWAKEMPVWIMDWMQNTNPLAEAVPTSLNKDGNKASMEYWYEQPIKMQKALGVPLGYHVYNWHWIPFNNDYPHYIPAKKEFIKDLHRLKENNIRVIPYTNARLWDTHDNAGEDATFTLKAKQWATKDANGNLFTEKYESHEPDGSLCELAAMCPSSGVWKSQMAYVLKELFNVVEVDGVYLDQIAAAAPYLCQDNTHNHLPGGGSWWAEQYNLMMIRNRQIRGKNGVLTTEDNAEVYAKAMDGFLSWVWTFDNLVPAFSVIYAGYVFMFGRTTNGLKKGDEVFLKYETAEQLVFGGQLGWLNSDVADRPKEFEFLKKMAQLRYRYSPFFYKGEALRPAKINSDRPVQLTYPMYFDSRLFEAKQVLSGTWRLWDKTRTIMFIINCDNHAAKFKACLSAFDAKIIEGEVTVSSMIKGNEQLTIEGEIAAEGFAVFELHGAID